VFGDEKIHLVFFSAIWICVFNRIAFL
jgi:hypothetical protein